MKKTKLLKLYLVFRKLFQFIIFYFTPFSISLLLIYFIVFLSEKSYINNLYYIIYNKSFFFNLFLYTAFFILFSIALINNKKIFSFIKKSNWFKSLGDAFFPAIIALSIGIAVTFSFYYLVTFLPDDFFLKGWFTASNQALLLLIEKINNKDYFIIISLLLMVTVFAPIFEEILFRGFLQDFLTGILKKKYLVIISTALIFGLFHITSLPNAIFAFIIGIFLSIRRYKDKSINVCIWIHGMINWAGLLASIIYNYVSKYYG